jgi:ABC-2 type transport system permease protein
MLGSHKTGWFLVLKRELNRMVSRPIYPIMLVVLPLCFLMYFATLMPQGLPTQLPIGVIDHDQSSLSRKVLRQVDASQQNHITTHYLHFQEARSDMQCKNIYGFVEIPEHFMVDVMNGQQPTIHFYYNQSYLIPGSLVLKDLSYVFKNIAAGANLQARQARGQSYDASMGQILPVAPEMHPLGNPWINYSIYLINVLLPCMLQLLVLLTTVYCIGIEIKKERSFKWYRISGGSLWKALFGKLLPYTIAFSAMGCIYDITIYKVMSYPLHNSIGWMFLNSTLLVLASQAMGLFLIGLLPTLPMAMSFSGLVGMLSFSFSGMSFPIDGMPSFMQSLSFLFPIRWYFLIYQNVALNGSDPWYSLPYYGYLLLYLLYPTPVLKRLRNAMIKMDYPKY